MWELWNRTSNVISIPYRSSHTVGLWGIDAINTVDGSLQDLTSVIINTKSKIADLFSSELKRYQKALNIPVAAGVWLAWVAELVAKPIVNAGWNTLKTASNFVTNARKSTFWSLFSTKPVSDISFNHLKRNGKDIHVDTTKPIRSRDSLLTEGRWFLTPAKKKARLEKKKAKIENLISKL